MPVSPAQEQAKASEFGMLAAQMKDAPHAQDVLSLVAPAFGIPFTVNEFGAAQRAASLRLEEYARVTKSQTGSPPTPETVKMILENCAEWARVDPLIDPHPAFLDYYLDWFMSDEGRNSDPLLRMVIRAVVGLHKKGLVAESQEKSEMEVAADAPKLAAAEEAANAQAEQAEAQTQQAHEQGKQELIQQKLGEQILAEQDREHEADVETEKELTLMDHQASIDAELLERKAALDAKAERINPPNKA